MKINKTKEASKFIGILAIIVFMVSLLSFSIAFAKFFQLKEKVTGYASGYVNLTINTAIALNVSRDTINWGPGIVNISIAGCNNNATLKTAQEAAASVVCGNWSTSPKALIIQNLGNINCSLSFQTTKNGSQFFGGNTSIALYQWNFSNKDADACGEWGEQSAKYIFANVNATAPAVVCNKLDFVNGRNSFYMDAKLVIPTNANNTGFALSDTITITGSTAV
jgi:hypothetical protein